MQGRKAFHYLHSRSTALLVNVHWQKNSLFFGPISNDPGSLHSCYREKSIFPSYKAKLNLTLLTNLIIDAYSD